MQQSHSENTSNVRFQSANQSKMYMSVLINQA